MPAVIADGKAIWVLGGLSQLKVTDAISMSPEVMKFDLSNRTWTIVTRLPVDLAQAQPLTALQVKKEIVLFTGQKRTGASTPPRRRIVKQRRCLRVCSSRSFLLPEGQDHRRWRRRAARRPRASFCRHVYCCHGDINAFQVRERERCSHVGACNLSGLVIANISALIQRLDGDPDRSRPQVKTAKLAGVPTCAVLGHPEFEPQTASEEHLTMKVNGGACPNIGDQPYLMPRHICRRLMIR